MGKFKAYLNRDGKVEKVLDNVFMSSIKDLGNRVHLRSGDGRKMVVDGTIETFDLEKKKVVIKGNSVRRVYNLAAINF